jgi:hypothetical protein
MHNEIHEVKRDENSLHGKYEMCFVRREGDESCSFTCCSESMTSESGRTGDKDSFATLHGESMISVL